MGMTSGRTAKMLVNGDATGPWTTWSGGQGCCVIEGTFGGATVAVEFQAPATGTGLTLGQEASLTQPGLFYFTAPGGNLRTTITGGTGVSVTSNAFPLPRGG